MIKNAKSLKQCLTHGKNSISIFVFHLLFFLALDCLYIFNVAISIYSIIISVVHFCLLHFLQLFCVNFLKFC